MNNNTLTPSKVLFASKHVILPFSLSISLFLLFYVNESTFLIFPIAPIIYGWKTRDRIGSIIIGMIPVFCLFLDIHFSNLENLEPERLRVVLTYFGSLIAVGGIEGYFAAKLSYSYFFIPLIILFLWYSIFLSGIN